MRITGRCHCGDITFDAEVDPAAAAICHCTDCQALSGSPYRTSVRAQASAFRLLSGAPQRYVKTADSGAQRAHAFCPRCGSPVYSADPVNPSSYNLRIGTLDQRAQLAPTRQQWCASALLWADDISALPRKERQ